MRNLELKDRRMRYVIYGIALALWFGMWIWAYTCHIKEACCGDKSITEVYEAPMVEDERPIVFQWGDSSPQTGSQFSYFRDSLIAELVHGRVLIITGIEGVGEDTHEEGELALARAHAAAELLAPNLADDRCRFRAVTIETEEFELDAALTCQIVDADHLLPDSTGIVSF